MGSQNPRLDLHDPKTLETLDRRSTPRGWRNRRAIPFRDFESDSEFRNAVSLKLTALAEDGVTDPVELLERALESLPLR
jgi:hypothetical protein